MAMSGCLYVCVLVCACVWQSITYRGRSLIQTAILLLVMYYFFGVVGFLLFPEKFLLEALFLKSPLYTGLLL
jgi:hypothetical protein